MNMMRGMAAAVIVWLACVLTIHPEGLTTNAPQVAPLSYSAGRPVGAISQSSGTGTNTTFWPVNSDDAGAITIKSTSLETRWIWTPNDFTGYAGDVKVTDLTSAGDLTIAGDMVGSRFIGSAVMLTNSAAPTVSANVGALWNSNSVLYWVTGTKTVLVIDGR